MGPLSRIVLGFMAIAFGESRAEFHEGEHSTYEEAVDALAGNEIVRALDTATKMGASTQACGAEEPAPEMKAYAYHCELGVEGPDPTPSPSVRATPTPRTRTTPVAPPQNQIKFYFDNDNLLMGLIRKKWAGNDIGFSHRLGLAYLRQLPGDRTLAFELTSTIYSKTSMPYWDRANASNTLASGLANSWTREYKSDQDWPINFADVTRMKMAISQGKDFYFKIATGIEIRKTAPSRNGKLPFAAWSQNAWHHGGGMYTFKYIPAAGIRPSVTIDAEGNAVETNGFTGNDYFASLAKTSVLVEGAVGTNVRILGGRCTLQLEVGGELSTNGKQFVGENTHGKASGKITGEAFRTKKGFSRLNAEASGVIFYFPVVTTPDAPKVGTQSGFRISSQHLAGKKGRRIEPFVSVYLPKNRNFFHEGNDGDAIQSTGILFHF